MANPFQFMQGPMVPGGMAPPPPPMPVSMAGPSSIMGGPMPPQSSPMGQIGPQALPPGMMSMLDPATNNQPLQFNTNKGKPPMPIMGGVMDEASLDPNNALAPMPGAGPPLRNRGDRDRLMDRGDRDVERNRNRDASNFIGDRLSPQDGNGNSGANIDSNGMMGMMANMMGGPMGYGPMMGPMTGDPNMMMMTPMANLGYNQYGQYNMGMGGIQGDINQANGAQKEIITLKGAILYPSPPNAPTPTTRERPPGCRTIFVGGLPENTTEDILREAFENCGTINSIRISKKNFAHIRFELEESVEKALYLSGYRMKIEDKDDKPNTGRIHVDYAQARDDLYEWECKQRSLAREMRHRSRMEEERLRPPSPPPIIHYSDHEASLLMEKLKADDSFMKATQVLVTWLERGDCARRSANTFYSMIQSVNSHVRRLMNEKASHDQELQQMKLQFCQRHEGILRQLEQIEKVFCTAGKQKAWDHFSKAQRKNLDMWRKQAEEIKQINQEEFLKDRQEDEMELSDGDDEPVQKKQRKPEEPGFNMEMVQNLAAMTKLQDENDTIKCQLEAYKNEIEVLKSEKENSGDTKGKQMKLLQQALQGMQQKLLTLTTQNKKDEEEISRLKKELKTKPVKPITIEEEKKPCDDSSPDKSEEEKEKTENVEDVAPSSSIGQSLSDSEARLIGIISTFLWVHPFGASLDYIASYLQRLNLTIRTSEIEDLLERLPSVFQQDFFGVGASLEKRWKFVGFGSSAILL